MQIRGFSGEEPKEEIPGVTAFFDINKEIQKLTEAVVLYPESLKETQDKHEAIIADLYNKIEALRTKHWQEKADLAKNRSENLAKLTALKDQKKREEQSAVMERTAAAVEEICADYESWFKARMYQKQDIISIVHQYLIGETGVMNANEMALGKTMETVVALYIIRRLFEKEHGRKPTILWLTKSSIIETDSTKKEFDRWDPSLKVAPVKGSMPKAIREFWTELAGDGSFVMLTNYELMRTTKAAQKIKWDLVVMDEVHKLKGGANATPTEVWRAVKDGVQDSRFIMMLTGTPLVNRIEEMWSYMHIFDPINFDNSRKFARAFSTYRTLAGQMKLTESSEKMLKQVLRGRLLRRTAEEVGLELPEIIIQDIILQHNPDQKKIYNSFRDRFFAYIDAGISAGKTFTVSNILTQLIRLRQINVLPVANFPVYDMDGCKTGEIERLDCRDSSKLDEALEIIQKTADQCLVFCSFNEPLNELAMRLQVEGLSCGIISAQYSKEMGDYETNFQQGKMDVLLINSSMGEGLNLQKDPEKWSGGARAGISLDRWYNNARNDQCRKRGHRPGSPGPFFWYDLFVENSVDYWIQDLCDQKDAEFGTIMNNDNIRPAEYWKTYLEGKL